MSEAITVSCVMVMTSFFLRTHTHTHTHTHKAYGVFRQDRGGFRADLKVVAVSDYLISLVRLFQRRKQCSSDREWHFLLNCCLICCVFNYTVTVCVEQKLLEGRSLEKLTQNARRLEKLIILCKNLKNVKHWITAFCSARARVAFWLQLVPMPPNAGAVSYRHKVSSFIHFSINKSFRTHYN